MYLTIKATGIPETTVRVSRALHQMLTLEAYGVREVPRSTHIAYVPVFGKGRRQLGSFTSIEEAALVRTRAIRQHILERFGDELRALFEDGPLTTTADTPDTALSSILASYLPLPQWSIEEDKSVYVRPVGRGRPAVTSPERPHWVVHVNVASGVRKRVKRCESLSAALGELARRCVDRGESLESCQDA